MFSLAPKPRDLRSYFFHLLSNSRVKTYVGTRAFSVAASTLWNSLLDPVMPSNSIVSIHHHLKTHLFRLIPPTSPMLPLYPIIC
jgi:hypothetical protein